jgi:hypothetical protein
MSAIIRSALRSGDIELTFRKPCGIYHAAGDERHVVDFLHRKFLDGLVDLENIHAPALDGACVGCSDRNGKESQVGADQDQNKCDRDNVIEAHNGSLDLQKL